MNAKYLCFLISILLSGCSPSVQPLQSVPEATLNPLDGIELKKVGDIELRFQKVKVDNIEDLARVVAEVDEWLFVAEDEKQARERIESEIGKLRARIETEVAGLLKAALEAPKGKVATKKMSKINSLLNLYPAPKTNDQRAKLEAIASSILASSRRVEDIRRLRYNEWAISHIQRGLEGYRNELKVFGIFDVKKLFKTNKDALINICISELSTIDPAFLEPVVIDLYNYVFGLTRDAMGNDDESRLKLARGFANPSTKRKTPSDF